MVFEKNTPNTQKTKKKNDFSDFLPVATNNLFLAADDKLFPQMEIWCREKKKNVVGEVNQRCSSSPGYTAGFVGPESAEVALRTPLRGRPECTVPSGPVRSRRGVDSCATGPIVTVNGPTD